MITERKEKKREKKKATAEDTVPSGAGRGSAGRSVKSV